MIRISQVVSLLVVSILGTAEVTAGPASKAGNRAPRAATGLESDDPAVRRQAITKLVADRDPSAVAQLSLALEGDNDESVRREAAAGLGDLGDKRGTTALKRCLQVEPSQAVKRSCRVSLARLDPAATTADSSQPASAPGGDTAPEPSTTTTTTTTTSPGDGHTGSTGTTSAGQQFDLRINVTAEDAAARPNHVYLELVSAADSTLALGFERVVGPQWSLALEPQFSAQSESAGGLMASTFGTALALRPHFYFLQQAPSGPYIAPFGSIGYYRVTFDSGQSKQVVSGTTWAVGAGVGWSLVLNARAVFKLSAVFAYARTAATLGATGMAASSSAADFRPFVSAGVMF